METFSGLFALYEDSHRLITLTKASDTERWYVFFDVRLNPRLSKQSRSRCRWFVTPWRSLWRHCSVLPRITRYTQLTQCNDKHLSVLVENNHLVWLEYANFGIMITSHCQFRVLGNVEYSLTRSASLLDDIELTPGVILADMKSNIFPLISTIIHPKVLNLCYQVELETSFVICRNLYDVT